VANTEQHYVALQELNRNYIRSVDEAHVAWFDANLAGPFLWRLFAGVFRPVGGI
jgi:hypothetical protein